MKNRASVLIKQIIAALSSMAKSKTLALKFKTHRIKAKLIIFSLIRSKKFLMSSISQKLQSFLPHHHHHHSHSHHKQEDCLLNDNDQSNEAIVVYNDNAQSYQSLVNPSETQVVEDRHEEDEYGNYCSYDDEKYPDLTHCLFDSEGLDFDGSVIDLVKNAKEEAGEEFKLEDEIDHVADLFIRKFRRQIILQKQESIKRFQEMLQRGA